jgi:hypothetical protein
MSGWKKAAMIGVIGEKEYLKSFGDGKYFVIPKKISILSAQKMRKLFEALSIAEEKQIAEDETTSPENAQQLVVTKMMEDSPEFFNEFMRQMLLGGVYDHNLDDENGNVLEWNDDLVGQICNMAEDNYSVPLEIFGVVSRYNAPLQKPLSEKSER